MASTTDWTAVFEPVWTVSVLPGNSTQWEHILEAVDADLAARDPVGLIPSARRDNEVPALWLPWLAEERSVDEFSSAWPEARRRAVTKEAFPLHQVKGTRPALERALGPLGFQTTLTEWFELGYQRNTFRIAVDVDVNREWIGGRAEIIRVANGAKNAHTKLTMLEVRRRTHPAQVYVGAHSRRVRTIRVGQMPKVGNLSQTTFVWVGAAQIRHRTLRVRQL